MMDLDNDDDFEPEFPGSQLNEEAIYICNSCGEEVVVPIDYSQGPKQEYVEDCPVCCNPNIIFVELDLNGNSRVWSRAEQDPR